MATSLDVPAKSFYTRQHNHTNINLSKGQIDGKELRNSYLAERETLVPQENRNYGVANVSNHLIITEDEINLNQPKYTPKTSSPYPSISVQDEILSSSSKEKFTASSPLVVLPLPSDITSNESCDLIKDFHQNGTQRNNSYNTKKVQHYSKPQSRVNELADYAKQYEDLYTRRMGTLNCSSSTSGSIPSASGSFYRNQNNMLDKRLQILYKDMELPKLQLDSVKSPTPSSNSQQSFDMSNSYRSDYKNYSNNHKNIIQWVKNHQGFASDAFMVQNDDAANDNTREHTKTYNAGFMRPSNYPTPNVETNSPNADHGSIQTFNNNFINDNKMIFENQEQGDPNKSGLPIPDFVRRPGVKSLVSAFNEQIESQKVCNKPFTHYACSKQL